MTPSSASHLTPVLSIPIDKKKMRRSRAILLASLVASILLFVLVPSILMIILGGLSALICGYAVVILTRRLNDDKPGLIMDQTGLAGTNLQGITGLLPWSAISELSVLEINRQQLIRLMVDHPQAYIDQETNGAKRKILQLNNKLYGSPVYVSAANLTVSVDELLAILTDRLAAARSGQVPDPTRQRSS